MPKILSDINPDAHIDIKPEALRKYPELATFVIEVIASWSRVDWRMAGLLTLCVKAEFRTVSAMLSVLNSPRAQHDAILAGIEMTVTPDDFKLITATFKTTTEDRKIRDKFAHHMWGVSPDVPDCLILANPRELTVSFSRVIANLATTGTKGQGNLETSKILVYYKADLEEALKRAQRAFSVIHSLGHVAIRPAGTPEGDATRQTLRRDPEISQLLQSQSRQNHSQGRNK